MKSFCFRLLFSFVLVISAYASEAGYHNKALNPTTPGSSYIFGEDTFGVGNQPVAIALGDFNGDGILDMVVANRSDNTISVLLGKPDGTFATQAVYATATMPASVAVGDFNGDGNLDVAVVIENCVYVTQGHNQVLSCSPGIVSILLGNGDGTFQPAVNYAVGLQPVSVAVGDLNGDGKLDLVVANGGCSVTPGCNQQSQPGTVSVLLGNGDGTFQAQVTYATANGPQAVIVADFNGDHRLDLATSEAGFDQNPGQVSILLGNGDGTFQTHQDFVTVSANGTALVAADFNHDGRIDLAVAGSNTLVGGLDIFLGNGDGTFTFKEYYNGGSGVVAADFNGDGNVDLATTPVPGPFAEQTSVLLGNGDGTFSAGTLYGWDVTLLSLTTADFNGDGKVDLAITGQGASSGYVSVMLGIGDGTFINPQPVGMAAQLATITSADFNGDGKLDLATTTTVQLGNGNGTFQPPQGITPGMDPDFVAAASFNNNGKPDIAVLNEICMVNPCNPGSVSIFANNGSGGFGTPVNYGVGIGPASAAVADFNRDGNLDLAVANALASANTISILLGNGDGTFQPALTTTVAGGTYWVAAGDFNGDGIPDLAVLGGTVSILLGNGDGTFRLEASYPFPGTNGTGTIGVADFNGDGKLDLAVSRILQTSVIPVVSIFLGNGDGTFQSPVDYPTESVALGMVQISDFNGDGIPDIAVGAVEGPASVLIGNGDGTFQPALTYYLPSNGNATLTVGDFNQDGAPDLLATDIFGNIRILLSAAFKAVSPASLNFGSEGVGTQSAPLTLTLSNPSNVSFEINSILPSGPFSQSNTCGASLAPGANCQVMVTFSPQSPGPLMGAITITDSTRSSPETIVLSGIGVSGPFLMPYPGRVNFAPQGVGSSSPPSTITLVNTGNASLTLNGVSISGADNTDFSQSNNCESSLAAGQHCTANVTFAPVAGGTRTAALAVSDSAPGSPQMVPLVGTGIAPPGLQLAPSGPSSATISAGQNANFSLVLTSLGGLSGTANVTCTISPMPAFAPTCTAPTTAQVNPNGPTQIAVIVSTTADGLASLHKPQHPSPAPFLWTMVLGMCWPVLLPGSRRKIFMAAVVILMMVWLSSCGGGNNGGGTISHQSGTPSGNYTATVNVALGTANASTTLTVTVQ